MNNRPDTSQKVQSLISLGSNVLNTFYYVCDVGIFDYRVKHVYGYEVVPEAISDARRNAKLNGLDNATFIQGDLNKISDSFGKEFPKPDIVISGMAP